MGTEKPVLLRYLYVPFGTGFRGPATDSHPDGWGRRDGATAKTDITGSERRRPRVRPEFDLPEAIIVFHYVCFVPKQFAHGESLS